MTVGHSEAHAWRSGPSGPRGSPSGTKVMTDRSKTEPSGPWPPKDPEARRLSSVEDKPGEGLRDLRFETSMRVKREYVRRSGLYT